MKNYTAPRTLSECEFQCGYPTLEQQTRQDTLRNAVIDAFWAIVIGVPIAVAIVAVLS